MQILPYGLSLSTYIDNLRSVWHVIIIHKKSKKHKV